PSPRRKTRPDEHNRPGLSAEYPILEISTLADADLQGVEAVGVEGDPALEIGAPREGVFVGPGDVVGPPVPHLDAPVGSVALERAAGPVLGAGEEVHPDVLHREVEDGGEARLAQEQGVAALGDDLPRPPGGYQPVDLLGGDAMPGGRRRRALGPRRPRRPAASGTGCP